MSRILTKDGWSVTEDGINTKIDPAKLPQLSKVDQKKADNRKEYARMVEENNQLKELQKEHVFTTEALEDEVYRLKIALSFCTERLVFPEGSEEALLMAANVTPLLDGFDAPKGNDAKVRP